MKEDNRPQEAQGKIYRVCRAACGSKIVLFSLLTWLAGFVVPVMSVKAQCLQTDKVFSGGEKVNYDVYFKWGLLMPKAGLATMTVEETVYRNTPAWHLMVLINTSGMVNKVFSIKDTIQNYMTREDLRLLYSGKRTNEGGYYEMDDLTYSYKENKTYIHAVRKNRHRVKADTVLTGGECVMDLLASFMYARSFNWDDLNTGVSRFLEVGMGKSLIKVSYRYEGQRIVEKDHVKFRTRLFVIDIHDDAFTESKGAMEIWIGDDENHIPVKMRAKLKIGAMEAYYQSSNSLRYPLTCRIEMPR
jgi:hypothetical protein